MPNTNTQIPIHFVLAVKNRQALIQEAIRNRVEKYINGIVQNFQHRVLAVYCLPDHAHLFVGFRPNRSLSDLMREVKSKSSEFINKERRTKAKFNWQEGYGAFSYSPSHVHNVIEYVLTRQNSIKRKRLRTSRWSCLTNLKFHTKNNIYLTG